jgi:chromodomain-helicase-DNA-binding protein 1
MLLEHAVINQIDTTGKNLGQKPKADYSREELGAILKYGASNLFKANLGADQAKLEEIDLDDVINKAEAYETATAPTGTSLGGEDFMHQFEIQDVKADTTSWDDIIPLADREKYAEDAKKDGVDVAAGGGRKRAPPTARDPNAMDTGSDAGSDGDGKGKKPARKAPGTKQQRAMALKDRDLRVLVRSVQKFGDIRHRYDAIVKDAKLVDKNRSIITSTVDELLRACHKTIDEHEKVSKATGAPERKKDAKAILFQFRGVASVNAETVVQRVEELKVLHDGAWSPALLASEDRRLPHSPPRPY